MIVVRKLKLIFFFKVRFVVVLNRLRLEFFCRITLIFILKHLDLILFRPFLKSETVGVSKVHEKSQSFSVSSRHHYLQDYHVHLPLYIQVHFAESSSQPQDSTFLLPPSVHAFLQFLFSFQLRLFSLPSFLSQHHRTIQFWGVDRRGGWKVRSHI